jgi:hypothetical protein
LVGNVVSSVSEELAMADAGGLQPVFDLFGWYAKFISSSTSNLQHEFCVSFYRRYSSMSKILSIH